MRIFRSAARGERRPFGAGTDAFTGNQPAPEPDARRLPTPLAARAVDCEPVEYGGSGRGPTRRPVSRNDRSTRRIEPTRRPGAVARSKDPESAAHRRAGAGRVLPAGRSRKRGGTPRRRGPLWRPHSCIMKRRTEVPDRSKTSFPYSPSISRRGFGVRASLPARTESFRAAGDFLRIEPRADELVAKPERLGRKQESVCVGLREAERPHRPREIGPIAVKVTRAPIRRAASAIGANGRKQRLAGPADPQAQGVRSRSRGPDDARPARLRR